MSPRSFLPVALLAAWFGAASHAEAACQPVVSGNKAGESGTTHAMAYDFNLGTRFNSSHPDWQWIQLDMQCLGRLQGVRRRMTRFINGSEEVDTGARVDTQGEGFSYSADGVTWTHLTRTTATGWQGYLERVAPHAWYGLPYGWSAWLRPLTPPQARYVRFNWDDNGDLVNEVEVLLVEDTAAPSYEVVDLGTLLVGGPFPAEAHAINKRGVVAGSFTGGGRERAVLWDLDFVGHTVARELDAGCGPICPSVAVALDVNDHDEAVGYRRGSIVQGPLAAHWALRTARPLPDLQSNSTSYGINNEGDVAGTEFQWLAPVPGGSSYAYRLHWEAARNGVLLDPSTYSHSAGNDINDLGDVVGRYLDAASQRYRPFFYRSHRASGLAPQDLWVEQGYVSGTASAISNARLIAGAQTTAAGVSHATVWRDGPLVWIPTRLDAGVAGAALGVNDVGHVVGHHGGTTAVLWRDGRAYNLNQLIPAGQQPDWQLREARDINDRGEIVGVGTHLGRATAFLLRPVRQFDIAPLDGAEEINDAGTIAGNRPTQTGAWVKVPGAVRPVGLDASAEAIDINDSGVVAGWSPTIKAALWSLPWSVLDLAAPAGNSVALAVSSSGHAAGYLDLNDDRALFWNERKLVSQPLPPGSTLSDVNTSGQAVGKDGAEPTRWSQRLGAQPLFYNAFIDDAFEIDSRGFVVGTEGDQFTDAKLWDLATPPEDGQHSLGTLHGASHTSAGRAINDRRQVVGLHSSAAGPVAFLWEQDTMIDLNLLMPPGTPWELVGAHDINDAGQILGTGRILGESTTTRFVMTLSSEAEKVTQLCRGWCEPIKRCGFETGPFNNVIWSRDDHPRYNGCVNGCVAYAMDTQRPHTLDQERRVRDCFLGGGQALCTQQWEPRTRTCCANQGLGSCDVYYN